MYPLACIAATKSSTPFLVLQKIIPADGLSKSINLQRASNLWEPLTSKKFCLIVEPVISFLAITICCASSFKYFFDNFLIWGGIVAENNKVCLSSGMLFIISSISSMNPIFSISSASSNTRNSTDDKGKFPLLIWSKTLPGVPTTILALFKSLAWRWIGAPPYTATMFNFSYLVNFTNSSWTCIANSLVGANIIEPIASLIFKLFIIGRPNAAVFPVPVWAWPIISLPERATGIASAWIGDGVVKPKSSIAFTKVSFKPKSLNVKFVI